MTLDCQLFVPHELALGWNLLPPESNYVGALEYSMFERLEASGHDFETSGPPTLPSKICKLSGHCVEFPFYLSCVWLYNICFQGI